LRGLDFKLMPDDLMIVAGKIGSGKTSLLYSIMDETVKKAGTHRVRGRIAYVKQNPFIFPGTVQDNICFGLEYAECRFRKAL
jgi:ATP-binding cassette subfamily C (CFTR/MRP) protein 4